jgi:hypothetical protein
MRASRKVALLVAVVALLAGCSTVGSVSGTPTLTPTTPAPSDNGIAALPVADILTKAAAALKGASSFHMKGQINTGSEIIGVDFILNLQRDGQGTLTVNGQSLQMTKLGTDVYLMADASYWTQTFPGGQGQTLATLMAGKYLRAPTTNPTYGTLARFFDFADQLNLTDTGTKGPIKTINGTPAISLVSSKDQSTLWVATQGEPFPLRLESGKGATLDFTDYNKPVVIMTPPPDQVIDLSKLAPSP